MRPAKTASFTNGSPVALFDTATVEQILCADSGIVWPDGVRPRDVRIERGWPKRNGRFVVEWSFRLGRGPRCTLFGTQRDDVAGIDQVDTKTAVVAAHGIRSVCVHVPRWGVRVHSLDCDSVMPHLAQCLDDREMTERLSPYWNGRPSRSVGGPRGVACRPLSYRVGRRAAISYRLLDSSDDPERMMGKTYCDGRGERLSRLHDELNLKLASSTHGRVCVPAAVHYFPDLKMAMFAWVRAEKTGLGSHGSSHLHDQAVLAADALAALHAVSVEGLPDFTLSDECAVISRWHAALSSVDESLAEETRSIADTLRSYAESASTHRCGTVHRDFYDGQFFYDGRTITLLDLDTLARGDPCVDLGNLLAHMFLASLRDSASWSEFVSAARLVLRRYLDQAAGQSNVSQGRTDEVEVLDRKMLIFYWASALFRVGAVHAMRTNTGRYVTSLWQLARELLTELPAGRLPGSTVVDGRAFVPDPTTILGEL